MKRVISVLLLLAMGLSLLLSLSSCTAPKTADSISCEEIIAAYEAAGYTLGHHLHEDPVYLEDGIVCGLMFEDPKNPNKNYIYLNRYNTNNEAYNATREERYNVVIWLFAALHGEARWLKSEQLGTLHCTTFDRKMLKPLQSIIEKGGTS